MMDEIERQQMAMTYNARCDAGTRSRLVPILKRITKNNSNDLQNLLLCLKDRQLRIAVQMKGRLMNLLSDVEIEFLVSKPAWPKKHRSRHYRLCKKYDIDAKVAGRGPDRNEWMRRYYFKTVGKKKLKAKVMDLERHLSKQILADAYPPEVSLHIKPILFELRDILATTSKKKS